MPRVGSTPLHSDAIEAGRDASLHAMFDRCVIEREQPPGDFDPATGLHDPPGGWTEVAQPDGVAGPDGVPCRIHPVPLNEDRQNVGEEDTIVSRYYARLPLGADVRVDDRIRMVAIHPTLGDPRQQDRVYRAVDPTARALATEARITVKEEGMGGDGS